VLLGDQSGQEDEEDVLVSVEAGPCIEVSAAHRHNEIGLRQGLNLPSRLGRQETLGQGSDRGRRGGVDACGQADGDSPENPRRPAHCSVGDVAQN
jgi:hypothetical protein